MENFIPLGSMRSIEDPEGNVYLCVDDITRFLEHNKERMRGVQPEYVTANRLMVLLRSFVTIVRRGTTENNN
jgi:hypothetical protein